MRLVHKITLVIVGVLLVAGGALWWWIRNPPLRHPHTIDAALREAQVRFAQLQREARNKAVNGYLDEEFLPFWNPLGLPKSSKGEAIKRWSGNYGSKDVNHLTLHNAQDPDYQASRAQFERQLPALVRALGKPLFTLPRDSLSSSSPSPNQENLRLLALGITAYTRSVVLEDQASRAVDPLSVLFLLGSKLQGRESLLSDVNGISLQRIAFCGLGYLPKEGQLDAQQWIDLASSIEASVPPGDLFKKALESELSISVAEFDLMQERARQVGSWVSRLFLEREKRIYLNLMGEYLSSLKEGELSSYALPEDSLSNWLSGRCGELTPLMTTDLSRVEELMLLNRRSLLGAATVCLLRSHRAEHGKLPSTLNELRGWDQGTASILDYDATKKTLLVKLPKELPSSPQVRDLILPGWCQANEKGLLLSL